MEIGNYIVEKARDLSVPLLKRHAEKRGAAIGLTYHRFESEEGADPRPNLAVTPEIFSDDLEQLSSLGYFISLDEYFERSDKSILQFILTFDDGYQDNYTILPGYLEKYNAPTCIYIVTDFVKGKIQFLAHDAQSGLWPHALNEKQIVELAKHPLITIGSHSLDHSFFVELEPEEVRRQMSESKDALEQLIQKPIVDIAIPSGRAEDLDWDLTIDLLFELKYRSFATNFGGKNLLHLPDQIVRRGERVTHLRRVPMSTNTNPLSADAWALGWSNLNEFIFPKDYINRDGHRPHLTRIGGDYV